MRRTGRATRSGVRLCKRRTFHPAWQRQGTPRPLGRLSGGVRHRSEPWPASRQFHRRGSYVRRWLAGVLIRDIQVRVGRNPGSRSGALQPGTHLPGELPEGRGAEERVVVTAGLSGQGQGQGSGVGGGWPRLAASHRKRLQCTTVDAHAGSCRSPGAHAGTVNRATFSRGNSTVHL